MFAVQGLANVLYGLCKLGVVPGVDWMTTVLGHMHGHLRSAPPQALSNTLWAVAKMGYRLAPADLDLLVSLVHRRLVRHHAEPPPALPPPNLTSPTTSSKATADDGDVRGAGAAPSQHRAGRGQQAARVQRQADLGACAGVGVDLALDLGLGANQGLLLGRQLSGLGAEAGGEAWEGQPDAPAAADAAAQLGVGSDSESAPSEGGSSGGGSAHFVSSPFMALVGWLGEGGARSFFCNCSRKV